MGRTSLLLPLLCACSALPLWVVDTPPLQDLPQHLAAIRVLHSFHDPAYGLSGQLQLQLWRTQYLAYYLCADGLSYLLDVELANRVLMSLAVALTPLSLATLLRALGRDPRAALLALPFAYSAHLILGFLNFVAALPLCFFGLSLAVAQRRAPSARRAWLLSGVVLSCFFMHVVPFCLLALGCGLCALRSPARALLSGLWPLSPSIVAVLWWAVRSPAGQATLSAAGVAEDAQVRITHWDAAAAWHQLPQWLTDVLWGQRDTQLLVATCALWLVWLVLGLLARGSAPDVLGRSLLRRLAVLPVLSAVAYFVAPTGYDWIWPIAPRFALLAILLSIPLLPVPGPRVLGGLSLVAGLLGATHLAQTGQAFIAFERQEVGDFDRALAAIPPARRVAGLIFDRGSRQVRYSPFLHYVALYQARKGGAVMFSFADFPQSPFAFRKADRPPRVPPRWEWMPGRVDPARELGWYDYVLVRGGPGKIARQHAQYTAVFRGRRWSVWKRRRTDARPAR